MAQGEGSSDAWHQRRYRAFTRLGHTRQERARARHFSNHLPRPVCFPSLSHNGYRAPHICSACAHSLTTRTVCRQIYETCSRR